MSVTKIQYNSSYLYFHFLCFVESVFPSFILLLHVSTFWASSILHSFLSVITSFHLNFRRSHVALLTITKFLTLCPRESPPSPPHF